MNKSIHLMNNYGKLDDRLPFLMADNEKLTLTFFSDIQLTDVFFIAKNGDVEIKHRLSNLTTMDIPQNLIKAGLLHISLQVIVRGQIVKNYEVEPIVIEDVNYDFKGFAEVETAIAEYHELKQGNDELKAQVEDLQTKLAQALKDVQNLYCIIEQGVADEI